MQQIVEVKRDLGGGFAEVLLERQSACSGDCHHCSGCGAVRETLLVRARNPIGARVGEKVVVESDTRSILTSAAVLYLVPILLFFLGYALGVKISAAPGLLGGAGFVLGFLPALLRNRTLKRRQTEFCITRLA